MKGAPQTRRAHPPRAALSESAGSLDRVRSRMIDTDAIRRARSRTRTADKAALFVLSDGVHVKSIKASRMSRASVLNSQFSCADYRADYESGSRQIDFGFHFFLEVMNVELHRSRSSSTIEARAT